MRKENGSQWRFRLGMGVFVFGWLSPLFIPLVASSSWPLKFKTALSGLLAFGIPELFSLAAIAILGKDGYKRMKSFFFGVFKKALPPDRVSPARYQIGLVFFIIPLLLGWGLPYVQGMIPWTESTRFHISLAGDLMFISSFFILGGEFWDKIQGLFSHHTRGPK